MILIYSEVIPTILISVNPIGRKEKERKGRREEGKEKGERKRREEMEEGRDGGREEGKSTHPWV